MHTQLAGRTCYCSTLETGSCSWYVHGTDLHELRYLFPDLWVKHSACRRYWSDVSAPSCKSFPRTGDAPLLSNRSRGRYATGTATQCKLHMKTSVQDRSYQIALQRPCITAVQLSISAMPIILNNSQIDSIRFCPQGNYQPK